MNIQRLRYFIAAAKELNFSRAARNCFITQPVFSRQIARLEEEWGIVLFKRDKHDVVLTLEGEECLSIAQKIVSDCDKATEQIERIRHRQQGRLAIGYVNGCSNEITNMLADTVFKLYHCYPECETSFRAGPGGELISLLKQQEIDMAAILRVDVPEDESIQTMTITSWKMCAAVSSIHPLANREEISLNDLSEETLFTADARESSQFFPCIVRYFIQHGIQPHFGRFSENISELLMIASSGKGIALMTSTAEEQCMETVKLIPIKEFNDEGNLVLCTLKDTKNPMVERMKNMLKDILHKKSNT